MNSAKWLRVQNADLERKVEQHKPELANALSAREAAFTKLKHARKVIRDLLEERVGRGIVERTLDWRTDELFFPCPRVICRVPEPMLPSQKKR